MNNPKVKYYLSVLSIIAGVFILVIRYAMERDHLTLRGVFTIGALFSMYIPITLITAGLRYILSVKHVSKNVINIVSIPFFVTAAIVVALLAFVFLFSLLFIGYHSSSG